MMGEAQTIQSSAPPSKPAPVSNDSIVRTYRQLKKQIKACWRMDEYRDNWGRPIRYNIVKIDVPNWCFGEPNLGYERKISHHATMMLHAAYFAKNYSQTDSSLQQHLGPYVIHGLWYPAQGALFGYNTKSRTIKLMPEVRAYIGRNAPRGFFIGGYYYFNRIDWKASVNFTDAAGVRQTAYGWSRLTMHGPGFVWGFQTIILNRVSLGFEMGAAILIGRKAVWVPLSQHVPDKNTPFLAPGVIQTRLNMQLGYCFGR